MGSVAPSQGNIPMSLLERCPSCGLNVRASTKFCSECGATLPRGSSAPPTRAEVEAADDTRNGPWWNGGLGPVIIIALISFGFAYKDSIFRYASSVLGSTSSTSSSAESSSDATDAASHNSTASDTDTEKRHAIEEYWDAVNADFTTFVLTVATDSSNKAKASELLTKMSSDADSPLPDGVSSDVRDDLDSVISIFRKVESEADSPGTSSESATAYAQGGLVGQRFGDAVEKVRAAYAAVGGDVTLIPNGISQNQ